MRRHPRGSEPWSRPPGHRLIRDAVEAEEIAVAWLRWRGFHDVRRLGTGEARGVLGAEVFADVTFEPLPIERAELEQRVTVSGWSPAAYVSFSFAGWTPELIAWADVIGLPLIRFTFAGSVEPVNEPAHRLGET